MRHAALVVGGIALAMVISGCRTAPGAHARWHTGWDKAGMTGEEFERDVRDCDRQANRVAAMEPGHRAGQQPPGGARATGPSPMASQRQMEHERGGIDRLVSNRTLYDDVCDLAYRTDPLVRQEIAAIESAYRIGRHLVLREVLGQAPKGFSAATKTFCTEFEQRVANFCTRVAGADATVWNRVSRAACYAPAYTIMGGTTQILRNIIGERLLGLPREPRPTPRE